MTLHVHPVLRHKIAELDGTIVVTDDGNDNLIMVPREPLPIVAMSSVAARRMIYYPSEIEWGRIVAETEGVVDSLDILRAKVAMLVACSTDAHRAAHQFIGIRERLTEQRIYALLSIRTGDTTTFGHIATMFHQNAHHFLHALSLMSSINMAEQRPWELDAAEYIHPITGEVLGLRDPAHFTAPMLHCSHIFDLIPIDSSFIDLIPIDSSLVVDFETV